MQSGRVFRAGGETSHEETNPFVFRVMQVGSQPRAPFSLLKFNSGFKRVKREAMSLIGPIPAVLKPLLVLIGQAGKLFVCSFCPWLHACGPAVPAEATLSQNLISINMSLKAIL